MSSPPSPPSSRESNGSPTRDNLEPDRDRQRLESTADGTPKAPPNDGVGAGETDESTWATFARPPPGFDLDAAVQTIKQRNGEFSLDPADAVEESVEEEIARQIAELEEIRGVPTTDKEKQRIAKTIRSLREGGWLEGLKLQLAGSDTVPIEYFNRLVAEHENTIAKVAQIKADADLQVTKKAAQAKALEDENGRLQERIETLTAQKRDLKDGLVECRQTGKDLLEELHKAKHLGESRLQAIDELKKELDSAWTNLEAARQRGDNHKNEAQSLRRQKMISDQMAQVSTDKIRRLESENKDLLEHKRELANPEGLEKQISGLTTGLAERDETIRLLKARLAEVSSASSSGHDDAAVRRSIKELQARCRELRAERDMHRDKWAKQIVSDNPDLAEFWGAVETTNREMVQLYRSIERLSRILGLGDRVLDVPEIVEKIIEQVTASVTNVLETPELTVLGLRTSNAVAQVQIEAMQRELNRASLYWAEDDIKARMSVVADEEVEGRVSAQTRAYREERQNLLNHIHDAQAAFMALAEGSADREAIEALVDRFLRPESLLPGAKSPA
ncbi:hypothetical protein SAMD00023353_3800290 [Rosellinia necatrix]|uniref:Uncharacterized protein n=1 Tax=Rosellinia necatrix TaxID=77044 RepID=A0A1W2TMF0_ROSNE|nr:hypothetical protein SAMD00023353_3800290 [Rosellinia necatrix]